MQSRQMEAVDPSEYVRFLVSAAKPETIRHLPFANLRDYFFNIRRRSDHFINTVSPKDVFKPIQDTDVRLIDGIIEVRNLSIYYFDRLLHSASLSTEEIPRFPHSLNSFTEWSMRLYQGG